MTTKDKMTKITLMMKVVDFKAFIDLVNTQFKVSATPERVILLTKK